MSNALTQKLAKATNDVSTSSVIEREVFETDSSAVFSLLMFCVVLLGLFKRKTQGQTI